MTINTTENVFFLQSSAFVFNEQRVGLRREKDVRQKSFVMKKRTIMWIKLIKIWH